MIKNSSLTTNGWMFVVFLVLALTTPFNPIINNPYFTLWWYPLVALYGLWVLYRTVYEKKEGA